MHDLIVRLINVLRGLFHSESHFSRIDREYQESIREWDKALGVHEEVPSITSFGSIQKWAEWHRTNPNIESTIRVYYWNRLKGTSLNEWKLRDSVAGQYVDSIWENHGVYHALYREFDSLEGAKYCIEEARGLIGRVSDAEE